MPDMEKVIGHLNDCMEASRRNKWVFVRKDIVEDAIALLKEQDDEIYALSVDLASANELAEGYAELLKEQETVRPEREGSGVTWWYVCGNCRTAINPNDKYCHECGRAVKWE